MSCLQKALEIKSGKELQPETYKDISTTTKVLDYVWTIIIQSHLNYTTLNNLKIDSDAGFQQSVVDFLESYRQLLSIPLGSLDKKPETRAHAVRAIMYAMKHFPIILRGMALFFKPKDLCDKINGILQIVSQMTVHSPNSPAPTAVAPAAASPAATTPGAPSAGASASQKEATGVFNEEAKIIEARLALYSSIVSGDFYRNAEMRSMLLPRMTQFMWYQLNASLEQLKALGAAETEIVDPSGMSNIFNSQQNSDSNAKEKASRIRHHCLKCIEIIGLIIDTLQIHATLQERKQCVLFMLYLLPLILEFSNYVKKEFAFNPNRHGLASVNLAALQGRGGNSDFAGFIESLVGNNQKEIEYVEVKQEKRRMATLKDDFFVMTVVLSLLRVMTPEDWENFILNAVPDDRKRVELCTKLCIYLTRCFGSHNFPKSWGMMVGFEYATILKFVRNLEASRRWFRIKATNFNEMTIPPKAPANGQTEDPQITNARILFDEEKRMWDAFFGMCIGFLKCPSLSKEKLSLLFFERYGDLRDPMSYVLKRTWKFFPTKYHLFPDVIRNFVLLADTQHDVIQSQAIECYFNTLMFEYARERNVDLVKKLTMGLLDTQHFSDGFNSFFFGELQKKVEAEKSFNSTNPFKEAFDDMQMFLRFVQRLCAIPSNDDNTDSRISATHDLLDFLKNRGYVDIYIKYLGNLCKLFEINKSYESLGHALLLHADLYKWEDSSQLPALRQEVRVWPTRATEAQPACKRREELFISAAEKLEEGQALETAYAVLQEAKEFNTEQEYDLDHICTILNLQARVAKSIADREGIPPEYYRVGFFGSDVDEAIRNKEFVYLAHPLEKLADFQERLEKQYPGCEFLRKTEDPGPDVTDTPGLKILVTPVKACTLAESDPDSVKKPVSIDPEHPTELPDDVEVPKPSTVVFLYSKPFRKEERQKGENEFVGLYLRKLFLYVKDAFPSCRCRSVVSKRRVVEVSPLQNAIDSVVEKTGELKMLIKKYTEHPESNPQPFIMLLNGVICAAVNGGTWMYKEAFLSEEYRGSHPDDVDKCDLLLSSIVEQIKTLGAGMNTLSHMDQSATMSGLFEAMQQQLQDTREMWNVND